MKPINEKSQSILRWGSWMTDLVLFCHTNKDSELLGEIFSLVDETTRLIQDKVNAKYTNEFSNLFADFQAIVRDLSIVDANIDGDKRGSISKKLKTLNSELTDVFDDARAKKLAELDDQKSKVSEKAGLIGPTGKDGKVGKSGGVGLTGDRGQHLDDADWEDWNKEVDNASNNRILDPPVISHIAKQKDVIGKPIDELKVELSGDAFATVKVVGLPAGISFDSDTCAFSGTPSEKGIHAICIIASNAVATDYLTFSWTIVGNNEGPLKDLVTI